MMTRAVRISSSTGLSDNLNVVVNVVMLKFTFTSVITSAHRVITPEAVAEGRHMFGRMISDGNWYIISQFVPAVVYIWLFTFRSICCIIDSYYSLWH